MESRAITSSGVLNRVIPLSANQLPALLETEGGRADDEGGDALTDLRVGYGYGDGVSDVRVGLENGFDLRRGDVLAGSDDRVGQAPGHPQPAFWIDRTEIPRAVPASGIHYHRTGSHRVGVSAEQLGASDPDLTGFARRQGATRDGVPNRDLGIPDRMPVGVAGALVGVLWP